MNDPEIDALVDEWHRMSKEEFVAIGSPTLLEYLCLSEDQYNNYILGTEDGIPTR